MKKIIALFLVLCFSLTAAAALAEDDIGYYLDDHPEAAVYESTWVAEDGDWRIEVYGEDGGMKLFAVHRLGDNKEDIWEYSAALDEDGKLTTVPLGLHYQQDTVTDDWTVTYYEDGDAEFSINEEGKLLWKDLKEDAAKDLAFEKIGSFYGTRWMKDDIEVIFFDWYDGQYDIRLYDTDTLTATGEFDNEEPFTVTFSYDENNHIVWTENGESTVLEYSTLKD